MERDQNAIDAVAEAWVSFEKPSIREAYARERDLHIRFSDPICTGHYAGYQIEAEELIERLRTQGYAIVPIAPPVVTSDEMEKA